MGIEHVALGTTTINTIDLGTLATSIARANGHTALRIAFLPIGGHNIAFKPQPGNPATVQVYESDESKEFFTAIKLDPATLPKDSWTLVPLEDPANATPKHQPYSDFEIRRSASITSSPRRTPKLVSHFTETYDCELVREGQKGRCHNRQRLGPRRPGNPQRPRHAPCVNR